jgi:polysaccharide export outer membrane protein
MIQRILRKKINILFLFLLCFIRVSLVYGLDYTDKAKQHYKLGEMYYEQGLYKESEHEFQKALELLEGKGGVIVAEKEEEVIPKEQEAIEKKELEIQPASGVVEEEPKNDYIIGDGDILYISVWENPDLSQEAIVRPDGKISFPLIDEVLAQGKTISELDKEISTRLKEYIRIPDVSISLKRMGGSKVVILGQVEAPGVYSLTGRRTVLEAISLAGGFTADSVASSVIVIKGSLSNPKAERINLNQAIHKPDSQQNIVLESEDVVFVPKKFIADVKYALDQIMGHFSSGVSTAKTIKGF